MLKISQFEICALEICEKFPYKHSETKYVKNWPAIRKLVTSPVNISTILRIKTAKFLGIVFI